MNRAHLERLREYQPRAGIAAAGEGSAFSFGFWIFAFVIVSSVDLFAMVLFNGCSPAETRTAAAQIEVGAGALDYRAKIRRCYVSASDGGTFRDFQRCACGVDREYGIDAAAIAPCPP